MQPFEYDVPLEAKVERRPIPLEVGNRAVGFDLRLAMGRYWLLLIAGIGAYRDAFIAAYPILLPDPAQPADADRCAQPEVWQVLALAAGRAMDGGALYAHLIANPANHAYDGVAGIAAAHHDAINDAAERFVAWFLRMLLQPPPAGDNAWVPDRLEYQFAASAPLPDGTEKVYVADEFYQDRLDWYSFDLDAGTPALDPVPDSTNNSTNTGLPASVTQAMIPIPVSFAGMPNTRW